MKKKKSLGEILNHGLLLVCAIYIAYQDGYRTGYWRGARAGSEVCKGGQ